jgi:hypothetical protein
MKKFAILLGVILIPALLALLGLRNPAGPDAATSYGVTVARLMLINPFMAGMVGGITALVVRHRRSLWVAVAVAFLFEYLALGLVNGNFYTGGLGDRQAINTSAMLSLYAFISAIVMHYLVSVIQKNIALQKDPKLAREILDKRMKKQQAMRDIVEHGLQQKKKKKR